MNVLSEVLLIVSVVCYFVGGVRMYFGVIDGFKKSILEGCVIFLFGVLCCVAGLYLGGWLFD